MDHRDEIIREIHRVAWAIEPVPLTKKAFIQEGRIPWSRVRYYFSTWNEAVRAAGLQPNPKGLPVSGYQSLDESELLEAIGDLWRATGRRPTESLMNAEGKFSVKPYRTRWGSWRKAVDAYIRQYGVPVTNSSAEPSPATRHRSNPNLPASPIIVAPTPTPKAVVNRRRILYGEPIDFRGLRYAPINEQGVVYLFWHGE